MKESSYNQRKYYFGVVVRQISFYRRWTMEFTHEWIKTTFDVHTTTGISTIEFEDLLTKIRVFTNIIWKFIIPLPNEDLTQDNNDYRQSLQANFRKLERHNAEKILKTEEVKFFPPEEDTDSQYCF